MLIALALSIAAQIPIGPELPAGVRADFSKACVQVEERLEKGDFKGASQTAWMLPKKQVVVTWDDSKVPASVRPRYVRARDQAFDEWAQNLGDVKFTVVPKKGDLRFSFESKLAEAPDSGLPAGSALFFSESPSDPRLEVVIGLNRGNPVEQTSEESVHNEVSHAVGAYLGVATTPFIGRAMGKSDLPMRYISHGIASEFEIASTNLRIAAQLRQAAENKVRLRAARPAARVDPAEVVQGPVLQGSHVEFSVVVTNLGNAPLKFRGIPDCSCVTTQKGDMTLQPDASAQLRVRVDTTEFAGAINKHLILLTNDVERPIRSVPIRIASTPRYRLLSSAPSTMVVPQGPAVFDVFLVTPEDQPLEVTSAAIEGLEGTVQFSPWKGSMADPDLNEGPRERTGTKLHVELEESALTGRAPFTLLIRTKDKAFGELRYNAAVQKGIVSLPGSLYLGEVGAYPRNAAVLLSRPGRPFKVLSAESTSSFLAVSVKPSRGDWEYQLNVVYKGGAPKGDFQATIKVKTDDPKQPEIAVPVQATVR